MLRINVEFYKGKEINLIALGVFLNGQRICTVGLTVTGRFNTGVSIVPSGEKKLYFEATGSDYTTNEFVRWCRKELGAGDQVRIVVEDSEQMDAPIYRTKL